MKKKIFNQKLNLKKETVVSLSNFQMDGVNGGNAPITNNTLTYTEGWVDGHCVKPQNGNCDTQIGTCTINNCLEDTFNMC